jgi:dihydroorotate dehydrogenase
LEKAVEDYLKTFEMVYSVADYIAVNVSSPNTPRLRELQSASHLKELLGALQKRNAQLAEKAGQEMRPLLVKISPDLKHQELADIVAVVLGTGVAGLIASNTTTNRAGLNTNPARIEAIGEGGLSGAPLRKRARQVVAELHKLVGASIPIIGVGGIFNAEDAWQMISAGASLIQIYTGFIYEGPGIIREINEGLRKILTREGFVSFDEAVGCRASELT